MTRRFRTVDLKNTRKFLVSHLGLIHANATGGDVSGRVLAVLEDVNNAVDYVIEPGVCQQLFAGLAAPPETVDASAAPTRHGLAMFGAPYVMKGLDVALTGIVWGRAGGSVRVTPLTWASELGLKPHRSIAPMMLGYMVEEGQSVKTDDADMSVVTGLLMVLWRSIPGQDCVVIGKNRPTGIIVTDRKRRRLQVEIAGDVAGHEVAGHDSPPGSAYLVRMMDGLHHRIDGDMRDFTGDFQILFADDVRYRLLDHFHALTVGGDLRVLRGYKTELHRQRRVAFSRFPRLAPCDGVLVDGGQHRQQEQNPDVDDGFNGEAGG